MGELEAIALSIELNSDVLIMDEVAGRNIAKKPGRNIIGMVGILLEAKKKGYILSVKPYLDKLRSTGFRMSDEVYQLALNMKKIIFLILLSVVSSCASNRNQQEISNEWIGKTKSELLAAWGEPSEVQHSQNEEFVIYKREMKHTIRSLAGDVRYLENEVGSSGYYNTYAGMSFLCIITFQLDQNETIQSVKFQGNDCQQVN